MSILESIRNRASLFTVLFVGFALLAFIFTGSLESGFGFFGQGKDFLAEINGHKIKQSEFDREYQQLSDTYMEQTQQRSLDQQTKDGIQKEIWNRYTDKYLYSPEYAKLGIDVSPTEVSDMLWGRNITAQILQAPIFQDSITHAFNPNLVRAYVENLNEDDDKSILAYNQWIDFEKGLIAERKKNKYTTLLSKGFYVPTAEAKRKFEFANKNAVVKYVVKRYETIADSTITVTEDDIKKAYEDNKFRFRQRQASRKLEVVTIDIVPSQKDVDNVRATVEALIPKFREAANDTAFVTSNSDDKTAITLVGRGEMPGVNDSSLFSAPAGTVIGPYIMDNKYKITKLVKTESLSDSVKARHILISTQKYPPAKAKAKADSIKNAIKGGANFALMALKFSDDQGSAAAGGELGFFVKQQMVKPFADACFYGNVGDMPVVESQFGVHIIEIEAKTAPKTKAVVATVDKEITPGKETLDAAYVKATEFAGNNNKADLFEKAAKKDNLSIRPYFIKEGDKEIPGIKDSKEVVIWAMDQAEKGDVSKAIQIDNKYIIACVKEIRSKGIPDFDEVKSDAEVFAKQAKKAEKFVTELSGSNLDAIALKAKGTVETTAVPFNSVFIPGSGRELALIGNIITQKPGAISKPIIGSSGVYVVVVDSISDLQPATTVDMKMIKKQYAGEFGQRVMFDGMNALEDHADITDKRYRYY